jgi:uncharacterized protein YvpB
MQRGKPLTHYRTVVLLVSILLLSACGANHKQPKQERHITNEIIAHLEVPRLRQMGTRSNCGPTAAAMVLGAYSNTTDPKALRLLRDTMGSWSYGKFALRRIKLPGVRGGMTPKSVLIEILNHHSSGLNFSALSPHRRLEKASTRVEEGKALERLKAAISDKKPVLALVQSGILWPNSSESLHWVVVTGISETDITINDPADGEQDTFAIKDFLNGWRLNPFFRTLPFVHSYSAIAADTSMPNPVTPEVGQKLVAQVTPSAEGKAATMP